MYANNFEYFLLYDKGKIVLISRSARLRSSLIIKKRDLFSFDPKLKTLSL